MPSDNYKCPSCYTLHYETCPDCLGQGFEWEFDTTPPYQLEEVDCFLCVGWGVVGCDCWVYEQEDCIFENPYGSGGYDWID